MADDTPPPHCVQERYVEEQKSPNSMYLSVPGGIRPSGDATNYPLAFTAFNPFVEGS